MQEEKDRNAAKTFPFGEGGSAKPRRKRSGRKERYRKRFGEYVLP